MTLSPNAALRPRAALGAALLLAGTVALAGCNRREAAEETAPAAPEAAAPAAGQAAAPPAKAPEGPPQRRAGLWEQRISMEGFVQVTRICIDPSVDRRLGWWGQASTNEICETNLATRQVDGDWRFSSVCDMGSGGKVTTSGVASGDFSTRYLVKAQSSTTGADAPQMNGTRDMTVESVWKGPCPAGFKPGDMELPGGMKLNLLDMGPMAGVLAQ